MGPSVGALRRRAVSIPGVAVTAVGLVIALPLWLPLAAAADLLRGRRRLPIVRLLAFATAWALLETLSVATTAALWCAGQSRNRAVHYRLQRWWAARLVSLIAVTTGIRVASTDTSALSPGPAIVLCRHASLVDALVSAWIVSARAGLCPRYVLKRELLLDPCLDIVGNRIPNHFLDRDAADSSVELAALRRLSAGMSADEVAVIFPEGTRSSPAKRARAIARIAERDPTRAARLASLRHVLPPRPAGSDALISGCPDADVVILWHAGLDGLDTFGGIVRHLARTPPPVRFAVRRIRRAEVPTGDAFTAWLDEQWSTVDADVGAMIESLTTGSADPRRS
jgi:1-acyl-sn-glycerol-3-phosphate acyltransferase